MRTTLNGTVCLSDGSPQPRAVVELHNATRDIVDQIQVDSAGRFTFHVAPGTWSLSVWDNEGHRCAAEVSLSEGEETNLDLALR